MNTRTKTTIIIPITVMAVFGVIIFGMTGAVSTFDSKLNKPWDSGFLYENDTYITSQKHEEPQVQSVKVIIPRGAVIEGNPYLIPEKITVVMGVNNTVTWINQDDTYHSFSSGSKENSWHTGGLKPGESSSVTFNETGIYKYHGEPGPWRTGTVIVLEE